MSFWPTGRGCGTWPISCAGNKAICGTAFPAVSTSASSIYSKVRIKEMEVIMLSKKVVLDLVLLVLTAGIIVAKAAYGTDWPSMLEGRTE